MLKKKKKGTVMWQVNYLNGVDNFIEIKPVEKKKLCLSLHKKKIIIFWSLVQYQKIYM